MGIGMLGFTCKGCCVCDGNLPDPIFATFAYNAGGGNCDCISDVTSYQCDYYRCGRWWYVEPVCVTIIIGGVPTDLHFGLQVTCPPGVTGFGITVGLYKQLTGDGIPVDPYIESGISGGSGVLTSCDPFEVVGAVQFTTQSIGVNWPGCDPIPAPGVYTVDVTLTA